MVEDNEGDILLTCDALQGLSFISYISVIKNGNEVISFFENLKNPDDAPDLVLLDIFLPQISGHKVLEYLRQNQTYKRIPVMMLTMSSAEKDILLSYKHYADYYITKPIEVDEFVDAVKLLKLT